MVSYNLQTYQKDMYMACISPTLNINNKYAANNVQIQQNGMLLLKMHL